MLFLMISSKLWLILLSTNKFLEIFELKHYRAIYNLSFAAGVLQKGCNKSYPSKYSQYLSNDVQFVYKWFN